MTQPLRHADQSDLTLLAPYAGAEIRLTADLSVNSTNELGSELLHHCGDAVRSGATQALDSGAATQAMCELPGNETNRQIELTFLPSAPGVVVLGRDTSLERRMHAVLVESRQRYQDLVAISGDFAWETDQSGAFVFVSPKGALGYAAAELIGRRPSDLLSDDALADTVSYFSCKAPVQDAIVWLRDAGGQAVCLKTSALPVLAGDTQWTGARGICRDKSGNYIQFYKYNHGI